VIFSAWFPNPEGYDPGHNPNLMLLELLSLDDISIIA
jgi:hypothetical protein